MTQSQSTDDLMQQLAANCVCPFTACWSCAARDTIERLQRELAAAKHDVAMISKDFGNATAKLYEVQADLAARDKTIETLREAVVVRLGLLEAYLDMGDISSVRSAIDAWKDAARSEVKQK